jgi:hypothetical protein
MKKTYIVKPVNRFAGSFVRIEAGSPKAAIEEYLKNINMTGEPVKMTNKFFDDMTASGLTIAQIRQMCDFIVELEDCQNPISGNSMWHIQ